MYVCRMTERMMERRMMVQQGRVEGVSTRNPP